MATNRRDFIKASGLVAMTPVAAAVSNMALAQEGNSETAKGHKATTDMVSQKPFDYSTARKYAPQADFSDLSTFYPELPGVIPQEQLLALAEEQMNQWQGKLSKSAEMQARGKKHMPFGVFGTYQKDWETPILPFCKKALGNKLWDVDGNEYIDFNFGDTPDMYGHGPENPAIAACAQRLLEDGIDSMMCNEDALVTAELLAEHFGLPHWMHALTASDANRYVCSIARNHTGRTNVAIPNFTYHGSIDETQKMMPEPGVISRYHDMNLYHGDVDQGTKIFTWNDLESLEEVLADRSVALVMMEPVMSNFGWAWPKEDWHKGVKALCKKYGTLLCYDETHTLGQGPNGMVGHLGIQGDFWTCGKAISSGVPGAVYGMSEEVAQKLYHDQHAAGFFAGAGLGMLGNALSGNTISTLALRVTLEDVFTDKVFDKIYANVDYMKKEMEATIEKYNAPFRIETMGNRLCYHFIPERAYEPLGGLVQVGFGGLFEFTHAYLWNHGMLIMPYFNMIIQGPNQTKEDNDKFLAVWDDMIRIIMGA